MLSSSIMRTVSALVILFLISLCCDIPFADRLNKPNTDQGDVPEQAELNPPADQASSDTDQNAADGDSQLSQDSQSLQPFTEFDLNNCNCAGITLPLYEDRSSFSNNIFKMGLKSGGEVEVSNRLKCDWQEDYRSENKTAQISAYVEIYRLTEPLYAQSLWLDYKNDLADDPGWCEADESCTVTAAVFEEQRSYYAEETFYQKGNQGEILPSTHRASIARLVNSDNDSFAFELFVTHPELNLGDPWVRDTALALENCVMSLIQ